MNKARLAAEARWATKRTPLHPCVPCLHGLGFGPKRIEKIIGVDHKVAVRWLRELGPCPFDRKRVGGRIGSVSRERARQKRQQNKPATCKRQYQRPIGPKQPKPMLSDDEQRRLIAQRAHERYHTEPQYMLKARLRNRIRRMVERSKAYGRTSQIIGCSFDVFKAHIQSQFTQGMAWNNYGRWHIDHIIPCASFDLTNREEVLRCFHFTNLRPLWDKANRAKRDRVEVCQPELLLALHK